MKLLKYMRNYTKESIAGPLFKMLEAVFDLLVPVVMASIIDKGIGNDDRAYILRMCLLLVALGIGGLGCALIAQYYAAKASVGFVKEAKSAVFAHIQSLSCNDIDRLGVPTLINRLTGDMDQLGTGVNLTLRLLLRSPFIVFGSLIMAFTISTRAATVFAVAIPILAAVIFAVMLVCIPRYKKVQEKLDSVLLKTRENVTGARVIRAFVGESREDEAFGKMNDGLAAQQISVGRISSLLNPLTYAIVNLGIVVLIRVGALEVDAGAITQGGVIALYNYMSQILIELVKLANLIINITKSIASARRVSELLGISPTMSAPQNAPEANSDLAVEFRDVSFCYPGSSSRSLGEFNLRVRHGETIGIIGGTGSGKSTLVNLIPRLYDASEGKVLVDGTDVKDYPFDTLRNKIGIVMQRSVLFKGSVRENMKWGLDNATDEEITKALEIAQAADVVKSKGGLDFGISQGGGNLSGGQRQRLTIARALVRSPSILILDDSFSALDFATDARLRTAIRKNISGMTVFLVSQRVSSIMNADRIVVLDDGNVAGIGTHEELMSVCGVYREIYLSQIKEEKADA